MAAPVNNLPSLSFEANGKSLVLLMSFKVTSPFKKKLSSTKGIFSILFSYKRVLTWSRPSFSFAVTSLSLGVIIVPTLAEVSETFLKSLEVTIPTKWFSSTTGMPEILRSLVNWTSSPIVLSDEIVIGSLTIPLSNFLTDETCCAWSWIDKFLWIMPIPPNSARAIAILASVTVSIAEDTMGIFKDIFFVNKVLKSASWGRTSE